MTSAQLSLLAALCALVLVALVAVAVREARGRVPDPTRPPSRLAARMRRARQDLPASWRARWRYLVAGACGTGALVWVITGWPVHGLLAAGAVLALPFVLHPGGAAQTRIAQLEAVAQWLNLLAGVHTAGISLAATVQATAKNAPGPIAGNVQHLALRLRDGMDPHDAFAFFADELADGVVDHVVLLLQSHAVYKGPGLADALEALAVTIHQQAADARDVEADRASVRKSSRQVSLIITVVVIGCMLNPAWSSWYQSTVGQIVLAVLGAAFAWTLTWMRRIARTEPDPRLLDPLPERPAAPPSTADSASPVPKRVRTEEHAR
ncbi:type II secretion system F family protein [Streptomyces sp. CLI2509]|uniref:type II secretion system F family protein n=2 Tax=unclassified Streptomyces TaxID=2593676 RepID=UPI000BAC85BA|nr:type II secretion system F family protein [Streptomyces sp. CLI2509]ASY36997.1 hypothetical protein CAC01_30630 [Streptomyces sp. CLI2509]